MSISIKEITSRGDHLFTVGFIDQAGWTPIRDCKTRDEAMAWVSYLNGGLHPDGKYTPAGNATIVR